VRLLSPNFPVTSPFGRLVLVLDPAPDHVPEERLLEIERALRSGDLDHRVVRPAGHADVEGATLEALRAGDRFIVAVGGDDTVHHVVNGMLQGDGPVLSGAVLGVVPTSGSDFVKTFGLPEDLPRACTHLAGGTTYSIDVGKVTCTGEDGGLIVRYFANVAQAGLGGAVAAAGSRVPGSSKVRHFLGFWISVAGFRPAALTVQAGPKSYRGRAHNIVVANCQYHGGGMRISPRSYPGDGFLDALVMKGPKSDAFTMIPKLYRGEHLPHRNILEFKAKTVGVESERPYPVEADGHPLGTTPASFEIIRHPIAVKI
jgi:diacylglycerol kinase (ATP)